MHIADWYSTFCSFVNVNPQDGYAVKHGLPDIDSVNLWPLISGEVDESPRTEIIISEHGLISGDYKLLIGNHNYAIWTEPIWPDSDTPPQKDLQSTTLSCVWPHQVCLFNVVEDPSESNNIAKDYPSLVETMKGRLDVATRSFYEMESVGEDSCPPEFDLKVIVGTGRTYVLHSFISVISVIVFE